jgi:hypothetical protein
MVVWNTFLSQIRSQNEEILRLGPRTTHLKTITTKIKMAPTIHQFKATHEKQATIINDIMVMFINMADDPNY